MMQNHTESLPGLSVQNINKTYSTKGRKDVVACNQVSFTIDPGQTAAVLGKSGCGKTTLMKIIAGFERADSGEITLEGMILCNDNQSLTPQERRIGIIFQDALLFPNLNVMQNINYASSSPKTSLNLVKQLDLEGLEMRMPNELSGGQSRRVAIARSLAADPNLLLMDEPFTGLDTSLKSEVRERIFQALHNSGKSSMIVTHDPEDAFTIADKLLLMSEGKIVASGSPKEVYRNCPTIEAARLMGPAFTIPSQLAKEIGLDIKKIYRPEDIHRESAHLCIERKNSLVKREFIKGRYLVRCDLATKTNDIEVMWWEELN